MLKKYTVKAIYEKEWSFEGKTGKNGRIQCIDLQRDINQFTGAGLPICEYKFDLNQAKSIFGSYSYNQLIDKVVYLSFDKYGRVNGCEVVK